MMQFDRKIYVWFTAVTAIAFASCQGGDDVTLFSYDGTQERYSSPYPYADTGHGVFYIPIEAGGNEQTATLSLSYRVAVNTLADGSGVETTIVESSSAVTIKLARYAEAYQPGKHLYLGVTLTFNPFE